MPSSHLPATPARPSLASLARRLAAVALLALAAAAPPALGAQQVERPIAFDSAQRVTALTPMLVNRLKLAPPVWPVTGDFREARLYAAGDGQVIVVQQQDGTLARYPLDAAGATALQAAIEGGMRAAGNPTGEPDTYRYSEAAGARFARRQILLGTLVYGPLFASLAENGETAGKLYLVGLGMPFFASLGIVREGSITRAQNDLATDAGLRMAVVTSGAYYAAGGKREGDAYSAAVLGGSLGGTLGALAIGRTMTDGEGAGMIMGSNMTTALTAMTMAGANMFEKRDGTRTYTDWMTGEEYTEPCTRCKSGTSRGEYGLLVGAALAGYPLGLRYVRHAGYSVTGGDALAVQVAGGLGALVGTTIAAGSDQVTTRWSAAAGGLFAGLVAGDRLLVKPFDYTRSEARLLVAGAVMGGMLSASLIDDDANATTALATMTAGALVGTFVTHRAADPRRVSRRDVMRSAMRPGVQPARETASRVEWQFDPTALALAAARQPGRHSVLSLTF